MNETTKNENAFIGYEYKDISVNRSLETVYADGYHNFGWSLDNAAQSFQNIGMVSMKFKRDRKIRNKAELTRLQRQFDACVNEINALERSKTAGASIAGFTIGIIGTAFMAGSVFAYIGGMLPLSILLAVPGFIGWILPYFCYRNIRTNKTAKMTPVIEKKYDEIYDVCEKGNALLSE